MLPRLPLSLATIGIAACLPANVAHAQDPALAPDDLKFTQSTFPNTRILADVVLGAGSSDVEQFHYEWMPESEKITKSNKFPHTYTRAREKRWLEQGSEGKTSAAAAATARRLDFYAAAARSPFDPPHPRDKTQGENVWKFVDHTGGDGWESFTYERTREHPRPDGVYPKFTFVKHPSDEDGKLMLGDFSAQLTGTEGKQIPISIRYGYEHGVHNDQPAAVWITGEVSSKNGVLFFRVDRPVQDNPFGDIVLLGSIRSAAGVFMPVFAQAADKHEKLRLYGVMQKSPAIPGHDEPLPTASFIVSKIHLPEDPDELPADQKIIVGPKDHVPGYKVEEVKEKQK